MADPRTNTFAAFADDDEEGKKPTTKKPEEKKEEPKKERPFAERRGTRRGGRYRGRIPRSDAAEDGAGHTDEPYERRGRGRRARAAPYRHYREEETLAEGKEKPLVAPTKFEGTSNPIHPYDRHSGTGTNKVEYKKEGHGRFNAGRPEDDLKEIDKPIEGAEKPFRKPRKFHDDKEPREEREPREPEPVTISYKDILKSQKEPAKVEEKREVKPIVDPNLVKATSNKEHHKVSKNFTENLHVATLDGDTAKFGNMKTYEREKEEKVHKEVKQFVLNEKEFPALA